MPLLDQGWRQNTEEKFAFYWQYTIQHTTCTRASLELKPICFLMTSQVDMLLIIGLMLGRQGELTHTVHPGKSYFHLVDFSDAHPPTCEGHPSNYFSNPSYHTLTQCISPTHLNNTPYGKVKNTPRGKKCESKNEYCNNNDVSSFLNVRFRPRITRCLWTWKMGSRERELL